MDLDEELKNDFTFSRFSPEKQDQIRQLVSYVTLMGLSGKDLISIGGRLERLDKIKERNNNKKIAVLYENRLKEHFSGSYYKRKFTFTSDNLVKYQLIAQTGYVANVDVKNLKTSESRNFVVEDFNVGSGQKKYLYKIALNIHHGFIKLDF